MHYGNIKQAEMQHKNRDTNLRDKHIQDTLFSGVDFSLYDVIMMSTHDPASNDS